MSATSLPAFHAAQHVLAANVRRLCANRRLTQKRFAEAAGIDVRHVQRIEAGRANLRLDTLCLLAHALGTTPAVLITGEADGP
ncbi:MAG: helix-turn-helix transcriptional regulator [Deltaproteobacteria bacterium]|nr:helix-turn-helix transcriptional regulator [Deltaproteobacteria bacterium]